MLGWFSSSNEEKSSKETSLYVDDELMIMNPISRTLIKDHLETKGISLTFRNDFWVFENIITDRESNVVSIGNEKWCLHLQPKWKLIYKTNELPTTGTLNVEFGVSELFYPNRTKVKDLIEWLRSYGVTVKYLRDLTKESKGEFFEFSITSNNLSEHISVYIVNDSIGVSNVPISLTFSQLV